MKQLFVVVCVYRGVGCIFYEMAAGRPLFPGSTVEDELHLIFRLLGEWLPLGLDYHSNPNVSPRPLMPVYLNKAKCLRVWEAVILWFQAHPQRKTGQESPLWKSLSPITSQNTNRSR